MLLSNYRNPSAKHYDLETNNYVIVDVETTGLSPSFARVIEIGALKVKNGRIVDRLDILVQTVNKVPSFITNLTGITDDLMAQEGVDATKGFSLFRDFAEDLAFTAHNVYFDFRFISAELQRYNLSPINSQLIDTVRIARQKFPFLPNHKLSTIKEYLKIDSVSHRGLSDAMVCWEILKFQ
ncbi:MAG TPA: exonuclease domain-containing protein [Candidatus Dojkabacteria bacterium]|nr:exonuclease domain-containing protein [Candidatus Dojkabacteria bacterium]HQF36876.1 exonuclease domain-containing protein [Candidatus Dojkabacteria bacterium]